MNSSDRHWSDLRDQSVKDRLSARFNVPVVKPHPKAKNQAAYLEAIDRHHAVVCTGPSGAGKTYLACGKAVELLRAGKVKRIVISRPLQECGNGIGYLPGDLYAKVVDMLVPLIESLEEFVGAAEVEAMRVDGRLVVCPLEKMRGRTMKEAFVILDEAQNATFTQLKMLVTRVGEGTKLVVCGDYTQSDLPYTGHNSLWELVERFKRMVPHKDVSLLELTKDDIVRSELVRWFVEATEGPFDPRPADRSLYCPGCGGRFAYPPGVDDDDLLVRCPHCKKFVELFADSVFDPGIVTPSPDDLATYVCGSPV
jgi:phosphate starvation-inducible PhoH-like protein